jgi:hypothetical protein
MFQVRQRCSLRCADRFLRQSLSIAHMPSCCISPPRSTPLSTSLCSPLRPACLGAHPLPCRRPLCPHFCAQCFRFAQYWSCHLVQPWHLAVLWIRLAAPRVVPQASQVDVLRRCCRPCPLHPLSTLSTPPSRPAPSSFAPSCPWACWVALWVHLDNACHHPSRLK